MSKPLASPRRAEGLYLHLIPSFASKNLTEICDSKSGCIVISKPEYFLPCIITHVAFHPACAFRHEQIKNPPAVYAITLCLFWWYWVGPTPLFFGTLNRRHFSLPESLKQWIIITTAYILRINEIWKKVSLVSRKNQFFITRNCQILQTVLQDFAEVNQTTSRFEL